MLFLIPFYVGTVGYAVLILGGFSVVLLLEVGLRLYDWYHA